MALDFFAGCVGGCAGLVVGHPFDTIKVRLQTDIVTKPRYKSATHCFTTTIKTESFLGLYKGLTSPMVGVALINAVLFGTYGTIQRQFEDQESLRTYFLAGGMAGLIQAFIASPTEMVKTRIQIQGQGSSSYSVAIGKKAPVLYKGPVDCLKKVYATEGIRGIFRGQLITLCREFFGFSVYFSSYEYFTQRFLTDPNEKDSVLSTGELLLAGGMSGVVSWIPTYPIDMIKSRLQVDGCEGPRKYKGAIHCAITSYKEEGRKAFTRGMAPTLVRAFPTNAATFTVVAWIMRLFNTDTVADVDDKLEALEVVREIPAKSEINLRQPESRKRFLGNLTNIGLLAMSSDIKKLAMYVNPQGDEFSKKMNLVSRVTLTTEELYHDYKDKMVFLTIPEKNAAMTLGVAEAIEEVDIYSPDIVPLDHRTSKTVAQPRRQNLTNIPDLIDSRYDGWEEEDAMSSAPFHQSINEEPVIQQQNDIKIMMAENSVEDSELVRCSPTCNNNTRCCAYSLDFIDQETSSKSSITHRLVTKLIRQLKPDMVEMYL